MPYYYVSHTQEDIVFAKDEDEARVEFAGQVSLDRSGADVRELDPEDEDDKEEIDSYIQQFGDPTKENENENDDEDDE